MHIAVCIKQVPETTSVRINPETNTLVRAGVDSIINPFDEFALELALELKDRHGAHVTVLSMGPPQAESALREALARGADKVVLLSDKQFAGSDTWATSYTLALAVRRLPVEPDLVLFGKQAIDGDTAQVGPEVSEFLELPLVTYACSLSVDGATFTAETLMDEGIEIVQGRVPAAVTVCKGGSAPRFASLSGWMKAAEARIPVWSAEDISADPAMTGLDGSPTRVKEIFAPPVREGGIKLDARANSDEAVKAIVESLKMVYDTQDKSNG